ncbi:MAG: S8 family serine peptidase [Bacteroidetes bacterium]|nr:S8 family serine peptidase [Bacteroidota bacterium]
MKNKIHYLLLSFLIATLVVNAQKINDKFLDGNIWVKMKSSTSLPMPLPNASRTIDKKTLPFIADIEKISSVKLVRQPFVRTNDANLMNVYQIELANAQKVSEVVNILNRHSLVDYAEQVPLDKPCALPTPTDPGYTSQWELNKVNAAGAWALFSGTVSNGQVVVALVDDAININHQDLNIWKNSGEGGSSSTDGLDSDGNGYIDDYRGYDVASSDNNTSPVWPTDSALKHGTRMAGIIAAKTSNTITAVSHMASLGYSLVKTNGSTYGPQLMPVKATNTANVITHGYEGIIYAALNKANIICIPWGSSVASQTAYNILKYAQKQECIIIAAAGNNNSSNAFYPAAYNSSFNNIVAVAATESNDTKASFSNYGTWIDVSAPGQNIYTTDLSSSNTAFTTVSGTSASAALVASLCGLMMSYKVDLSSSDVINCLQNNTDAIVPTNIGTGRINAQKAIACLSATQYSDPFADFDVHPSTIMAGGYIWITNKSKHAPSSFDWQLQDATIPNQTTTSLSQQVTGFYPSSVSFGSKIIRLIAKKGSKSDTAYKTIMVNPGGGCDTVNWAWSKTTIGYYYNYIDSAGNHGHIFGVNDLKEKEHLQRFDLPSFNNDSLVSVSINFGYATSSNAASKYITVNVYEDDGTGKPGTFLGQSSQIPFQTVIDDVQNNKLTRVTFGQPIELPTTGLAPGSFFVGISHSHSLEGNLDFAAGDRLAIVASGTLNPVPFGGTNQVWTRIFYQDKLVHLGDWGEYPNGSGQYAFSPTPTALFIFPNVTNSPLKVNVDNTKIPNSPICSGDTVIFDASASTYQGGVEWEFPYGFPSKSTKIVDTIIFINTGASQIASVVKLKVTGGACMTTDSMSIPITILPSPKIIITTTPKNTNSICQGTSVTFSAGASLSISGYNWSPAAGLTSTVGAVVIATPTVSTTYEVTGASVSGGCSSTSSIFIRVDSLPIPVINLDTTKCAMQTMLLDGSLSKASNSFSWSASGASPATSTYATQNVVYNTPGLYTVSLTATNNCGSVTTAKTFSVACISDVNELELNSINSYYNSETKLVQISFVNGLNTAENHILRLVDNLGKVVSENTVIPSKVNNITSVDVSKLPLGIYYLSIHTSDSKTKYVNKLIIY